MTRTFRNTVAGALLVSAYFIGTSTAFAVACPGTAPDANGERQFHLDGLLSTPPAGDAVTCFAWDTGNDTVDNATPGAGAGFVLIDRYNLDVNGNDNDGGGTIDDGLNIFFTAGDDFKSGTWSVDAAVTALYKMLYIALKDGEGDPVWASFALNGETSGNWDTGTIFGAPGGSARRNLSHATLYGVLCTPEDDCDPDTEVPLPAAAWLLLSGMLGLFGVARRRAG